MKRYDVVGICNALVDILVEAQDFDLADLGLNKGIMHLVEADRQQEVLAHFGRRLSQGQPLVDSHHATVELGGSALNAIRTLASLGRKTVFAGMIGSDEYGTRILHRMRELGIEERLGRTAEGTGTCVILITPDGERTMNTHLGASRLYDERNIPAQEIEQAKVVHFCGYQWDTDGQKRGIRKGIDIAKQHETLVSFDVADPFAVGRNRDAFIDVITNDADIVFANREEAHMLWGGSPEEAASKIAATGAVAVIKLGADGALVQRGLQAYHIKPVATRVVDSTAAGDMFAAGFLYGFTAGKQLDVCGHMAATAASDVISRVGAVVSDDALSRIRSL
jgi:sugar/nucleoside kinase (ribokinase family)